MKYSIVMAHYNRSNLLFNTLKSISYFIGLRNDIEIVIIDDASSKDETNQLKEVLSKFDNILNIKTILIKQSEKKWVNPCVPFNKGFKKALGEYVIIQNPENLWSFNMIDFLEQIDKDNFYNVFGCYSLNKKETEEITNFFQSDIGENFRININNKSVKHDGDSGWYLHPKYRNVAYHFFSCISKKNLEEKMNGGFDEDFANGIAFDDNEFVIRIQKSGLPIKIHATPYVVHQNHYGNSEPNPNAPNLVQRNRELIWQKYGIRL